MLELQATADALGVHYQTAYRWVRSGRLPAQLIGGKYLVSSHDLSEVTVARHRPQAAPAPSPARLHRQSERLHAALLVGDEAAVRKLANRLVDEGTSILDLIEQVISPSLRRIGRAWHDGELTIWVEHRASGIIERVLGDIAPNPRGRRRGTVMVAAVEGDLHTLPTTMAAVTLRGANWNVHHLGAGLPTREIVEFCAEHPEVDVAVISVTNSDVLGRVERLASDIRSSGTPTLIGGAGKTLGSLVELVQRAAEGHVS